MFYKFISWFFIYRKIVNFSTIIAIGHVAIFTNYPFAKLNCLFKTLWFSVVVL